MEKLKFDNNLFFEKLLGPVNEGMEDYNLRIIEKEYNVKIKVDFKNLGLTISGDEKDVSSVQKCLEKLYQIAKNSSDLTNSIVENVILLEKGNSLDNYDFLSQNSYITCKNGEKVYAKTPGQERYLQALLKYPVVICIGNAGTGKTFLAAVKACLDLKANKIDKILVGRPAIESVEDNGYLPGNLAEKLGPFLGPIRDSMEMILGPEIVSECFEEVSTVEVNKKSEISHKRKPIEILSLGHIKGRTFKNKTVIIDEAEDCTLQQFSLLLTRIGENCKMYFCGDLNQAESVSNPNNKKLINRKSGLEDAIAIIEESIKEGLISPEDVAIVRLDDNDVVRSRISKSFGKAFSKENIEKYQNKRIVSK